LIKHTCPFCDDTSISYVTDIQNNGNGEKIEILSCKICGVLFPIKAMSVNESNSFINEEIYVEKFCQEDLVKHVEKDYFVSNILKKHVNKNSIALDVGSHIGGFVLSLNKIGFNAYGVDICENAVEFSVENGLKCFYASFSNLPTELVGKEYSIITFMETFYYFEKPNDVLLKVHNLLINNGILLIQTINAKSRYFNKNTLFSRYGDNAQFFPTYDSIKKLLENNNFIVNQIESLPSYYINKLLKYNGVFGGAIRMFGIVVNHIHVYFRNIFYSDKIIIIAKKRN
jgi:SAM-dependent methyltransferase